jgi:hypothetical protein
MTYPDSVPGPSVRSRRPVYLTILGSNLLLAALGYLFLYSPPESQDPPKVIVPPVEQHLTLTRKAHNDTALEHSYAQLLRREAFEEVARNRVSRAEIGEKYRKIFMALSLGLDKPLNSHLTYHQIRLHRSSYQSELDEIRRLCTQ